MTELETAFTDDLARLVTERIRKLLLTEQLRSSIQERLQIHQLEALQDEEPFSQASLQDAVDLLRNLTFTRDPAVFLNDNGTVQIRWRNAQNEQINIQFLGHGNIRYVRFLKLDGGVMERASSVTTIDMMKKQLVEPDQDRILSQ